MLPYYIAIGLSVDKVLDSTPKDLKPYKLADELKQKRADRNNWMLGIYICEAIGSCFGGKYPKEPMYETQENKEKLTNQQKLDAFMAGLNTMASNWKSEHNGGTE